MEPERRIEKVLRTYAKKRRDEGGAAPELHPATRRLLQDEVARRRSKPAGSGDSFFAGLFASLGRKLAFAACAMALVLIGGMLIMPSLSGAKYRAQSVSAASNLKQIGQAVQMFASENKRAPASLDEIKSPIVTEKTLIDPQSGQRFVYVGGDNLSASAPDSVVAYSPVDDRGRLVLFGDGRVEKVSGARFAELSSRGVAGIASSSSLNHSRPADMIAASAPPPATAQPMVAGDKENADGSKLIADAGGVARLENRQRERAATEKSQLRESVTPDSGAETVPGNAAQPPAVITVTGGAALSGVPGQSRHDLVAGYDSSTNTVSLVDKYGTGNVASWNGQQTPAEVPKSEANADLGPVANALTPAPASVEELKAGTKQDFKSVAGQGNEAAAVANVMSQQYVQTIEPADGQLRAKKILSPVLASFQVEQSAQNLRVVDQDGSVYSGYWRAADVPERDQKSSQLMPTTPPTAATGLPEADARAYKDQQQAVQNYIFQVTGTNRSLKQNVVFNGNFMALTNGVPLIQMNGFANNGFAGAGAGGLQNKMSNQTLQLLLSNSCISGTAIIDNNKQIQINAVPATGPK
jgi:hypothetical protein